MYDVYGANACKIKFIYVTKGGELVKFQHENETTTEELARSFINFLIAVGYSPEGVNDYMTQILEDRAEDIKRWQSSRMVEDCNYVEDCE